MKGKAGKYPTKNRKILHFSGMTGHTSRELTAALAKRRKKVYH
jgi:hypothetical protein